MAEITRANPQVVNIADVSQQSAALASVTEHAAASTGEAYQAVAQAAAAAIQDATDHLRNLNTISANAIGVAITQMRETHDTTYAEAIAQAKNVASKGIENFAQHIQDDNTLLNKVTVGD